MRTRASYQTVEWGGRKLVPVRYVADGLITLRSPAYARRLHRAGTVGVLSQGTWADIQAAKGSGVNLDTGFVR